MGARKSSTLSLQGLLLRDNGYQCDEGVLYYAESKERVTVPFTNELIARTLELLEMKTRYIVSYDIANAKRLRQVHKTMLGLW
jgi:hypothetical protein